MQTAVIRKTVGFICPKCSKEVIISGNKAVKEFIDTSLWCPIICAGCDSIILVYEDSENL